MLVDIRDLQEIRITLGDIVQALRLEDWEAAERYAGRADLLVYEISSGRGRKVTKGGTCGWCHEYTEGDVFKHVQACRRGFDQRQARQMQAAAAGLTRIAKDLETK